MVRRMALRVCGWLAVLWLMWPHEAWSQATPRVGLRGGATVGPDQVHMGFHVSSQEFAPHLRFQPNIELGVGDNATVLALNPEINYLFVVNSSVKPYAGGGIGITVFDKQNSGTSTEVGINLLVGMEVPLKSVRVFLIELKVGVGDIPDLKLTFGVTF